MDVTAKPDVHLLLAKKHSKEWSIVQRNQE